MRTTRERGYGAAHQHQRARWQRIINQQPIKCATCPTIIPRHATNWDLGHTPNRTGWLGPQCQRCNRADGGRRGAAKTNQHWTGTTEITRTW
jgi:hypothetical protein